jgi:hypothetical protein
MRRNWGAPGSCCPWPTLLHNYTCQLIPSGWDEALHFRCPATGGGFRPDALGHRPPSVASQSSMLLKTFTLRVYIRRAFTDKRLWYYFLVCPCAPSKRLYFSSALELPHSASQRMSNVKWRESIKCSQVGVAQPFGSISFGAHNDKGQSQWRYGEIPMGCEGVGIPLPVARLPYP